MSETGEQQPTRRQADKKGYDAISAERTEANKGYVRSIFAQIQEGKMSLEQGCREIAVAMSSLALQRDIANEEAKGARKDPLTQLNNRGVFDEELGLLSRQNEPFSLFMLDLNDFKGLNDKYGHKAGDIVLAEISLTLSGKVRQTDVVCRWGGDEFGILLPGLSDTERMRTIGQSIVEAVASRGVLIDEQNIPVTISAGGGIYKPDEGQIPFFKRIDKALYSAKEAGKNRLVLSSPS